MTRASTTNNRSKRQRDKRDKQPASKRRRPTCPDEHPCSLAKWELTAADAVEAVVEIWDNTLCEPIETYPTVPSALARAGDEGCGDIWLWCLHCHRFFQAKHLELDFLGNWQRCPYDDCQAAGFDVDIRHWTNGKTDGDWPTEERELYLGLQHPLCHCPSCSEARAEADQLAGGRWTTRPLC